MRGSGRLPFSLVLVIAIQLYPSPASGQLRPPAGQGTRDQEESSGAEGELQQGIELTRQSRFQEAIPLFLTARGRVRQNFVLEFNLALCYVATNQFKPAIEILTALRKSNQGEARVHNLLAQAYLGNEQLSEAIEALQKAAAITPNDEKLYLLVADACMERRQYSVGLDVSKLGLKHLPDSAPLLYQHAMFLALLDQFDVGRVEFERAMQLAGESEIAYLAGAQKASFEGDMPEVIRVARAGIRKGFQNAGLLTILGDALIRSGVAPGQPEFSEAVDALEKAGTQNPGSAVPRIGLGRLYLMDGRLDAAVKHLEAAGQLDPANPSVYANLAKAYRRKGEASKADEMLAILTKLNQEQAETIRSSPGERKASYLGTPKN